MNLIRAILKSIWLWATAKEPDAIVAVFCAGPPGQNDAVLRLMRELLPDRRLVVIAAEEEEETGQIWLRARRELAPYRIALCAVPFGAPGGNSALRRAAFLLAPRRILAFNAQMERHHLRLTTIIASLLFLRGKPLDRIFLRPSWLVPWKSDRSVLPENWRIVDGRGFREGKPRVAVVSPYMPWPLSHGGAVRLWNLLRHASRQFDIVLFGFEDGQSDADLARVAGWCSRIYVAAKPRYREPRWSTLLPPEACEYFTAGLDRALLAARADLDLDLLQGEYTQMARYRPEILVEHDVTWDLYAQVHAREWSLSSWWNLWRWRRFERHAVCRAARVVAMSEKDARLLGQSKVVVIPNGVDLARFQPEPEPAGQRLLFIGSFRHFPNVVAYRFFTEQVWPLLRGEFSELRATVVAGPEPDLYWPQPSPDQRIERLGFVEDVRPLYCSTNIVMIPTLVSAGTNLKALEAMAMARAIVSTSAGVAGLGLVHGESVLIADDAAGFAAALREALLDSGLRRKLAAAARAIAVQRFDWRALALRQTDLWRRLHPGCRKFIIRPMAAADCRQVAAIQQASPEAAQWDPADYLIHRAWVAVTEGRVTGFAVLGLLPDEEAELLNIAVDPSVRKAGAGALLLEQVLAGPERRIFLEVRESNASAINLYSAFGFREIGRRDGYYTAFPGKTHREAGIVMSLQKW